MLTFRAKEPGRCAQVPADRCSQSRKFALVLGSIRGIGLVEAPVVIADTRSVGTWYLLDGHLRLEALKELGFAEVECLVATDDDTYTYNKRVNRLAPIQEHRVIARAIERGVSSADIADALGLQVEPVIRRFRLSGRHQPRGSRDAEKYALLDEGVRCPAADERRSANRSGRFDDRSAQFYAYVRASDTRCHASQPVGRSEKDDRR
ncbi:ParB/RepB/Spo0J family partition protein, partial [Sinorhizobium meliloti]|uniref:ParB/RepB/Spo0J family partition protein n=1 Tax=Rhizobium meliloti TaxID=382 RepID=UPI000FE037BC